MADADAALLLENITCTFAARDNPRQGYTAVRDAVAARDVLRARATMRMHILGAATRLGLQLDNPTGDVDGVARTTPLEDAAGLPAG